MITTIMAGFAFGYCVIDIIQNYRARLNEYELTMDEDLEKKYQDLKERDAQWEKLNAHYENNFGSEPKDWGRFQPFAKYTDDDLKKMRTMYDTLYSEDVDSANGVA